ncbi:hypothetical protein ACFZCP_38800 [Streptomyces sp. NPDC007971]|uniref:hypothetical protein n=1 Tax=Streptomyces sp. NPDC007971 TaxID=3364799 RepID=UPI0036E0A2D7
MNILSRNAAQAETTGTSAPAPADYRLPLWFFALEGVLAAAFDIFKAFPAAWPVLLLLLAANITISLTMMRKRLGLAKALWRGRETRKIALGLIALRIAGHFAMNALGLAVTSTLGHALFALAMGALTIGLLAYSQHTAIRALTNTVPPAPAGPAT